MCKEKYHENEALEYYCQQCKVCICLKCGQSRHGHHQKVEIQQAAEERKVLMANVLEKSKANIAVVESKINEQIELRKKSRNGIIAAEYEMTKIVEELIQNLRAHEMVIKTKLAEINETQEVLHVAKLEKFQLSLTELKSSIERGESIYERCIGLEILQEEDVFGGLEELLNQNQNMKLYKPEHVYFVENEGNVADLRRLLLLGQVVVSNTDHSKSVAEGKGLKEVELGIETSFTVTTRDSEGKTCYHEQDQVNVTISSPTGEQEVDIHDCKDGNYAVQYKLTCIGPHVVRTGVNGCPLSGSPWTVNVTPHCYKVALSCGWRGKRQGEFDFPWSIAMNEKTGNIAVADYHNKRIQLFDGSWKYLKSIGDVKVFQTAAVKIGHPISVAFLRNADIIVLHEETPHSEERTMSVITHNGQFFEHFSRHVAAPVSVFVKTDGDGHVIVCDSDKRIKVLSPDGAELLQSFGAPNCDKFPSFAFYHLDKFFVAYHWAHCVKVFNKEGVFLYDIGSAGSGYEQLCNPVGLAVDGFNNIIVCDDFHARLKVFTLDGNFLGSIGKEIKYPWSVAVCQDGSVVVSDLAEHCIYVLQ